MTTQGASIPKHHVYSASIETSRVPLDAPAGDHSKPASTLSSPRRLTTVCHTVLPTMECDICNRRDGAQIGMHCTVCARTAIYGLRIEHARLLLEKETLSRKFEQATITSLSHNASNEPGVLSRAWHAEFGKVKSQAVKDQVEAYESASASCRAEISQLREEVESKRAGIAQRRKDLKAVKQQVPSRRETIVGKLNQIGNKGLRSFDNINKSTIETRAFLCREAATLLGLKCQKVKDDSGRLQERFQIAGHAIPDLRYIHSKPFSIPQHRIALNLSQISRRQT